MKKKTLYRRQAVRFRASNTHGRILSDADDEDENEMHGKMNSLT